VYLPADALREGKATYTLTGDGGVLAVYQIASNTVGVEIESAMYSR
jgi:hypothetical protein